MIIIVISIILGILIPIVIHDNFQINYKSTNWAVLALYYFTNVRYYLSHLFYRKYFPQLAGVIAKIFVYPIKSVGFMEVNLWEIDSHGLKHDRQYGIGFSNNGTYKIITQRECSQLSKVRYQFDGNNFKVLYLDDLSGSFSVPAQVTSEYLTSTDEVEVVLWGNQFKSFQFDVLPEDFLVWAGITKKYPNKAIKLLYSEHGKTVSVGSPFDKDKHRQSLFQDYFPLLLISTTDVAYVNSKITADFPDSSVTVQPLNFRPNIVLQHNARPFDIDTFYKFSVGDRHLWKVATKCIRCVIPNINLDTGKVDPKLVVLKTLKKHRLIDKGTGHAAFGVNCIHYDSNYTIKINDPLKVFQRHLNTFEPIEP